MWPLKILWGHKNCRSFSLIWFISWYLTQTNLYVRETNSVSHSPAVHQRMWVKKIWFRMEAAPFLASASQQFSFHSSAYLFVLLYSLTQSFFFWFCQMKKTEQLVINIWQEPFAFSLKITVYSENTEELIFPNFLSCGGQVKDCSTPWLSLLANLSQIAKMKQLQFQPIFCSKQLYSHSSFLCFSSTMKTSITQSLYTDTYLMFLMGSF